MNELGLFAGAGGGLLASRLLGWRTVCAVDLDAYCQRVLAQRQRDGMLDPFPIWDDVRTFDGRPWREHVDVISGGFPCQDISSAGRGAGIEGERSGLWREFARIVREVRPAYVFVENSPMLASRGLGVVLGDLAALGFDARWDVLGARHVGAPHRRDRMWIVAAHADVCGERGFSLDAEVARTPSAACNAADARGQRRPAGSRGRAERIASPGAGHAADAAGLGHEGPERQETSRRGTSPDASHCGRAGISADANGDPVREQPGRQGWARRPEAPFVGGSDWWSVHRFAGVDDGVAHRLDRVRATGNGQVPAVAALAWALLSGEVS